MSMCEIRKRNKKATNNELIKNIEEMEKRVDKLNKMIKSGRKPYKSCKNKFTEKKLKSLKTNDNYGIRI